jgi:hypothetical protein
MGKSKRKTKLSSLRKKKQIAYARPENQYAHEAVAALSQQITAALEREIALRQKIVEHKGQVSAEALLRREGQALKRLTALRHLWNDLQLKQTQYMVAIKTRMLLEARQAPKVSMHWGSLEGLVTTPHQAHVISTHPQHQQN